LPRAFAEDPYRMARFEREAQLLASLNHPKIAAIYGLEESDSTRALVMELVEGPTLAERIGKTAASVRAKAASASPAQTSAGAGSGSKTSTGSGAKTGERAISAGRVRKAAIPIDEALLIAQQVTEALEYAHEHGVVHRDLKPANIKVTPDGDVKVLDFGLAKAMGPEDGSGDISNSPTLSLAMTEAGLIIGTAAYMAPEQAKGKPVDRRADIWAFGCLLYEMLTGRKAFEGETVSDILAAVIRAVPDWTALPGDTPIAIRRLMRRCLAKDANERLRDIGDARLMIGEVLSGADLEGEVAVAGGLMPPDGRASRLRRALPWGVAVAFILLSGIMAFVSFRQRSTPAPATRSFITAPDKVQFAFGALATGAPLLSPDGTRLVFPALDASGKEALWVRPLDSLSAQRLQGTEGATFPFWAPDSRRLGFFQNGELKKIDVTGGPPVLVCDAPNGRGGTWNRDGVIVFAPDIRGGLSRVPAAGGTATSIVSAKTGAGFLSDRWPEFLPDGKHYLYLGGDLFSVGTMKLGIYIGTLGTQGAKFLLQTDSDALYAAPGYLLFLRGDTLLAQRFDAGSIELEGEAIPVAENIPYPSFRLGLFSVSQTGLLVHAMGVSLYAGRQLVWVDATGKEIGKAGPANAGNPSLSPDGKILAYGSANSNEHFGDIWLLDLARGVRTRFTFGPTQSGAPVWSPDGSRIAYSSGDFVPTNILMKETSGAGNEEILLKSETQIVPTAWSHDDRHLLYATVGSLGKMEIGVLPLFGDRKPFIYHQAQFNELHALFSPDDHWVAYTSDESGKYEVYVSTFPAGGAKWQVSQGGGNWPEWGRDGREIYYEAPGGKMMEASVTEKGTAIEVGTPHELFQLSSASANDAFAVTPDGRRFLVVEGEQRESQPLTLVTNWTAGLEK
jgi:Tol biopolymer transport system component